MHRALLTSIMLVIAGCGDASQTAKAQKEAAKRGRDKELLALDYPASSGSLPPAIVVSYDGAGDRTTMILKLEGLRPSGSTQISSATLFLTSSHKGYTRAIDNPEGSADGGLIVQTSSPGVLAYSGAPGSVTVNGQQLPLRESSDKQRYISSNNGREEVRFRFPTEALVAAANADAFTVVLGTVRLDISGKARADFREFVARMNPRP